MNTTIGDKVRMYRQRERLSQMDLEVGIDSSFGSICRIESGKVNPTKETLSRIAKFLRLKPTEIADLMDIQIFSTEDLIKAINEFSKHLTLQSTLQTAVDLMFNLFPNYNGGIIFLIDKKSNSLYSQTVSNNSIVDRALKHLPKSLSELTLPISMESENMVVQSIIKDKALQSDDLFDFAKGVVPRVIVTTIQKILGFKVGLCLPIKVEVDIIGAVLYSKRVKEEFTAEEINLLSLLTDQIGISVKKARIIEKKNLIETR